MRVLMRICTVMAVAAGLAVCSGCGKKEKPEKAAEPASEVGVGDAIDYAIGKKQIEIMKESDKRIDRINKEHNERLKEAMGE